MKSHVRVRREVNSDCHRTGVNPACYVYEVRLSELIGLSRFCRGSPDVYVGAVFGRAIKPAAQEAD
jgi:hypothetical protein